MILLFFAAIIFSFTICQPVEKKEYPLPETDSRSARNHDVKKKITVTAPVVVVPDSENVDEKPMEVIENVPAGNDDVIENRKDEPAVSMSENETTNQPNHPYSILLASYRKQGDIERALPYYSKMKLSPYWTKVDLEENGIWYRLFTGHYSEYGFAVKELKRLKLDNAVVKKVAYTVLIGTYQTEKEAETDIDSLNRSGFPSFLIQTGNGSSTLYSGAFYTRTGAETHCADLSSYGYACIVAEQ